MEQEFLAAFEEPQMTRAEVAEWLRRNAAMAAAYSQRSTASVTGKTLPNAQTFSLLELIDRIEETVGTPVQTAVKRVDEQAFAMLNGRNLMFVEDGARRIHKALLPGFVNPCIRVRHLERLHPYDAVA